MLCRLPRQIPPLAMMLEDLGNPHPHDLARALGVTTRTVYRWLADPDHTPRAALLALFWATRWGQSQVDAEAVRSAQLHAAMASALRAEIERLRAELARVLQAADFGCANDMTLDALPRPSAQVLAFRPRLTSAS